MSEWISSKRQAITSIGEDVEKTEPLCTVSGNLNCYGHCGKQYGVPLKTKNRTTTQSSNFVSMYLSKENMDTNLKRYMLFNIHCSIISKNQDMEA